MKISVFGLGYVGTVTAAYFARQGHCVLGVDVNRVKTELINKGRSPVVEKGLRSKIACCVKAGSLSASLDSRQAVLGSAVSFICVGTPSLANGSLDLTYVKRAGKEIALALRHKKNYHLIVLRSTVLPWTTEKVFIPIIEKYSRKKQGVGFGVVFNPEFLREVTALDDFDHPPCTIIGAFSDKDYKVVAQLYRKIKAPLIKTPIKTAEMVKYANNAFHALKVTFANEIGSVSKALEIDSFEVMDILCLDKKLNISEHYLKPGFAFGGSCLSKDLRALLCKAKTLNASTPVLKAIVQSNQLPLKYAVRRITALGKKRIGVLGLAFKAGSDDLRQSPIVELAKILLAKGYRIKIYDRNVSLAALQGANKEFIEKKIPQIRKLMAKNAQEILDDCEVIVIGNGDRYFAGIISSLAKRKYVVDLAGTFRKVKTKAHYQSIN